MLGSVRQQWQEGARRLASERDDPVRYAQLCDLVEVVVLELRRRVGRHFTLAELARAHAEADDWVREVIREATPEKARAGVRDAALIGDAAFASYARGAVDWTP